MAKSAMARSVTVRLRTGKSRTLVVAAAGAIAFSAAARAADPPEYKRLPEIRTVVPTMDLSGWYLRADAGYRATTAKDAVSTGGFPWPTDNRVGDTFYGGVGAGFKWGPVRVDVTADYGGEASYTGTGGGAAATARIQTITGLFNAYYDIGTWSGFTPYIGAGAGAARVTISEYQSLTTPPLSMVGSNGRYNFAWALMTGVNYQVWRNLSVDVGYRFLDQGTAQTASDASGTFMLGKLRSHEARVGLRWIYYSPSSYGR
jgi:opacity protein-like surface antigen